MYVYCLFTLSNVISYVEDGGVVLGNELLLLTLNLNLYIKQNDEL